MDLLKFWKRLNSLHIGSGSQREHIHPVFHVSLLKKSVGSSISPLSLPIKLSKNIELIVQPEQIRKTKLMLRVTLKSWLNK